jgi:hypothetical protein
MRPFPAGKLAQPASLSNTLMHHCTVNVLALGD